MTTLLLAIIYICFISLGLPDSVLGASWPVIYQEFSIPVGYMGFVTMIISGCTIISALFADKLIRKCGTRVIVSVSIFLTAIALLGFSFVDRFWLMLLFAIPYGLGAGAIDAALNNYVALHYKAKHMSWLHCFWGVGTLVGPYAMSYAIGSSKGWRLGYLIVAIIQFAILVIVLATLPLWKKVKFKDEETNEVEPAKLTFIEKLKTKGVIFAMLTMFAYCSLECTGMQWASTYFVQSKGISEEIAAALASLFYIGITLGRFLSGFLSIKVNDKNLIRIGLAIIVPGIVLIALPLNHVAFAIAGIVLTGLGCAPVFPTIIHETPFNFGKEKSQAIIGLEMASAYLGMTFMSPLFGVIANNVSAKLYPAYLAIFFVLILIGSELLNHKVNTSHNKQ